MQSAVTWEAALASAVLALRQLVASHAPGDRLPTARELANRLGLQQSIVVIAMRRLVDEGLIKWGSPGRSALVRAPGELSPEQVQLLDQVRSRVACGDYRPGQALPASVLAASTGCGRPAARRALAHLAATEGIVAWHEHGAYGPGFYVTALAQARS
ncbi:GntR family transcriptional regulator [Streptomyces lavendulocolor]|uniref:GntR family transcriptional regulator n=1 Tax=Streptomyces lavendulocolor TaxID=67316 RepID=UPI0031E07864